MKLIAIETDSLELGAPLPFSLRGANGVLLASKGYVINTMEEMKELEARGLRLYVEQDAYRNYAAQLQKMVLEGKSLGEIAAIKLMNAREPGVSTAAPAAVQEELDWPALQLRATQVLRSAQQAGFAERFYALHDQLAHHCDSSPDATLLALIYLSANETRTYSATHAMLVCCVCRLVTREILHWSQEHQRQIGLAALGMNISITQLQDQLAEQVAPLTAQQIAMVDVHADRSVAMLEEQGITDPVCMEAIRYHHHRIPGPLGVRSPAQQMGRLIQRADIFGARIAPRATRAPMPVTSAMQGSYYDEEQQMDEAGAALVKALGIYPPGAFVRLASQEVAIVLRRGKSASTPEVAVVVNRDGMPTGVPSTRDTAQAAWKIAAPVAHRDVRVHIPLERLLALV